MKKPHEAQRSLNILTTVMTHIVVDKSTDHAKPFIDLFLLLSKKIFFLGREPKKALRDK